MNISMSMGFLKPITNFFKKYTALLPSIGITVVALLLLPVMLLIGGNVREKMSESVRNASTVTSLLRNVPSKQTPQQVKRYMDRLEEEASQIEQLAVESSMRELISYDVFPPKGTSSQLYIAFGKKYRSAVESMVASMNALDAPSDAEIRTQTGADARTTTMETRATTRNDAVNPMIETLCLKRSQEISVYAHPSAFAWYDFWENYEFAGQKQALEDCWDSQVSFWIYKDVVATISTLNAGSDKVSSSPVKRLLGVSFSGPVESGRSTDAYSRSRMTRMTTMGFRDKPNYIISSSTAGATAMRSPVAGTVGESSNFVSNSLTQRSGDADIDVIHFAFSVLVDNRYVMAFMKELCSEKPHTYRVDFKEAGQEKNAIHNQITILDTEISAVEKDSPEHELYRYGSGAVMRLDLVCEYQFYRKGYDAIKPEPVKEALGQQFESQDQGQPASTRPMGLF